MARFLALDWDNTELHLVAANVSRGKVHIQRAVSWREAEPFVPANAEQFGARLRDRLKEAGIAPAPVIIGLGRDRMVVKEVRYPQVPPEMEAAIVRNQIIKDLTESPDDVLLDFAPVSDLGRQGEKRALSLVVRKETVNALQTVCREAGLKLVAVTARPFGIAGCFKHLAGHAPQVPAPPTPDAVVAVLTVTGSWAEFCAVRGQEMLFARSVTAGDGLLGEVRRNLAAYSGQPQLSFPRDAIQALYVAGNGENAVLREKLQETLGIPVHGLDPFAKEDRVQVEAANRAGFAGAVGLLHLWSLDETTPVNFVKPRESKQVASPHRRRVLVYSAAAVLALAFIVYGAYWIVGQKEATLAGLRTKKEQLDRELKDLKPEIEYLKALKPWRESAIPWLDELFDLAARTPHDKGFRIKKIEYTAVDQKKTSGPVVVGKLAKEFQASAKMNIWGVVDTSKDVSKDRLVTDLKHKFDADPHCRCSITFQKKTSTSGITEFGLEVLLNYQLPPQYTTRLVVDPARADKLNVDDDDDN